MIKRKLKDALRETKVRIHGVPFIHRISENKFDSVETWVRADGHGTIRKTDDGRFGARYEMWNDIAKKYETRVIEPKDEIEDVVDQMTEDITDGERKKKAREEARKRMMGDAKADDKFVIMHPKKNLYLTVGGKTWSEENDPMIKKFKSEAEAEAYAKKNTANFRIAILDAADLNKAKVRDDYGWEIPVDKAWDAYESIKNIMDTKKLLLSLEFAMGTDDVKEATKDIAADWDEETEDIDELVELAGEDEVLDAIAQWLSVDDLTDNIAFICRMNGLQIPELVDEEEIEVDDDIDMDDALWAQPDNDAGSAGVLTKERPIKYKDYLILTREDGMFDVYTRRDFDLVGTEFKTVEEAKKNIDEGRKDNHIKTEVDEDFDEDEEVVEAEETEETVKPDPDAKIVNFGGYRIMKQKDGSWTIIKGGLDLESRKPVKTAKNFAEAVEWLYKTDAKIPFPGNATKSERLIAEYLPAEFKDSVDKVTEADIKPGFVFAYSINPAKHFVVKTPQYNGEVVFESFKKTLHMAKVADLIHDLNNGDLILVSKGE